MKKQKLNSFQSNKKNSPTDKKNKSSDKKNKVQ